MPKKSQSFSEQKEKLYTLKAEKCGCTLQTSLKPSKIRLFCKHYNLMLEPEKKVRKKKVGK
jgi:hypothetical protein